MSRRVNRGLVLVGVKLEPEVHAALLRYAEQHDVSPGTAGRALITAALDGDNDAAERVDRELKDAGYREGLRQAANRVRTELAKLLKAELE